MLQLKSALRRLFHNAHGLPSPSRRPPPAFRAGQLARVAVPHQATLGASWSSAAVALPLWARRQQHTAAMLLEQATTPPSGKPAARRARATRAQAAADQAATAIDAVPLTVVVAAAAGAGGAAADGFVVEAAAAVAVEERQRPVATPPPARKKSRPPAKSPSQLVLGDQAALEFKARRIAELLGRLYPNPPIPLDHGTTFQLLCAVLLSAQVCVCRDGPPGFPMQPWCRLQRGACPAVLPGVIVPHAWSRTAGRGRVPIGCCAGDAARGRCVRRRLHRATR